MAAPGSFQFGSKRPNVSQVFFRSKYSLGFVNIKPVVPGHVLVIPKRYCKRFAELNAEEMADLWTSVQKIGPVLEKHFSATSLTLVVQDGAEAGQTVDHVHTHILPRKKGDFKNNDDIYNQIDASDKQPVRTEKEMADEATTLVGLFPQNQSETIN